MRAGFGVVLFAALALFITPVYAEKRIALVIGNSSYKAVPQLSNPVNDSTAIALMLRSAGYEVQIFRDLNNAGLRKAVRDFADAASDADVAVVYYAGHGIEVDGTNYLVPVDAALKRDLDAEDEAVSLDRVMKVLEPTRRLRLVILDACRDNPFSRTMKRSVASRTIGRGLARVEPVTSDTLIAFAARAGSTADDGDSAHSPFTTALLKFLPEPGLDLRIALGRVRDDVLRSTDKKQEPFVYGSLGGDTVALIPGAETAKREPYSPDPAAKAYEFASKAGTKEGWKSFLSNYPTGFYADLGRTELAKLTTGSPNEDTNKKAPAPSGERTKVGSRHDSDDDTKTKSKSGGNAKAVQYYCGSVPAYEAGIKQGTTNIQSLNTVRRQCAQARAGRLTRDQFGKSF